MLQFATNKYCLTSFLKFTLYELCSGDSFYNYLRIKKVLSKAAFTVNPVRTKVEWELRIAYYVDGSDKQAFCLEEKLIGKTDTYEI